MSTEIGSFDVVLLVKESKLTVCVSCVRGGGMLAGSRDGYSLKYTKIIHLLNFTISLDRLRNLVNYSILIRTI